MSVASLFAHGDVTGRDQDVRGRDRKITQLGLKAAHFKHLHIGKEVPTRQHYEEIPHILSRKDGVLLLRTCILMHAGWGLNKMR